MEEEKLRLALSILSGRVTDLDIDDYGLLGWDTYNFGYYGKPNIDEIKEKCEDVLFTEIFNINLKTELG